MNPIFLFDLASQQTRWLSIRQAKIAENVSNANTPGFKASDVAPFDEVFSDASLRMAATNSAHIGVDPLASDAVAVKEGNAWEVTYSGNSVSLEKEMIKAGEVNRAYSLNTGVVKVFNQMLLASIKG